MRGISRRRLRATSGICQLLEERPPAGDGRAEEVLRFTRENGIDLIVVASHPVDSFKPSGGLGTMSYKLGILAPCAVLLVK